MIDDYLRSHDGVITLAQARNAGMHKDAVRRLILVGHWRRVFPGVYFADDRPFTDRARIRAAVWGYGSRAVASGLAAAWWHDLIDSAPEITEVTAPRTANGRTHPNTRLRRRDLAASDIVERCGLLVTSLPLTAIEAAARRGGGPAITDRALQRHTELPTLWRAHVRNKGRYGSPRARMILQAAEDGTQSQAERLFAHLMRSAGITGWVANYAVGPYRVDFAFDGVKVAVEIDGFAFHSDPSSFRRDRKRQNFLIVNGWRILRFTWADLIEQPDRVVAELRRAISV